MTIANLLAGLIHRGVAIAVDGLDLKIEAPRGVVTDELLTSLRAAKPRLVDLLTCPSCGPLPIVWPPELVPRGYCQRCSRRLFGDPVQPAWSLPEGSPADVKRWQEGETKAEAEHDDQFELDPNGVKCCFDCDRFCDTETIGGAWRCSRCDPDAELRRRTTEELCRVAASIRRRERHGRRGPPVRRRFHVRR
ncbi:MAG: hypothetical protein WD049_00205 [Candidatus Paceibacterota bacterium]